MPETSRTLADLFPEAQGTPGASTAVRGLASDSRKVVPGGVFVAVPGTKADGMSFVPQAVAAGAAAVVGEGRNRRLPRQAQPMCRFATSAAPWRWRRRASTPASRNGWWR
jgi:UDP-N-acetylmuramyl pentapeptide synthase